MLSYYIIANGKQKVKYTNGKNNGRESQSKTSEIWEKEPMEQGGSSTAAFFVMSFFHVCDYCKNNGKRFAVMTGTFFLFAVYSSFSFPAFITEDVGNDCALVDKYDVSDILRVSEEIVSENVRETGAGSDVPETAEQQKFRSDDWRLVLINKQNSIPEDYTFQLGTIKGSMQCDKKILEDLFAMLEAAEKDGVNLTICSPYRDLEYQQMLFNRKIKRYMNRGMSYMEAYQLSSQAVTVPGASEHQIGLALDIVCNDYMSLDEGFGDTKAGKWLAANSCRFGFILRYPEGKENITGIEYEPWHFRYVGKAAAPVIMEQGITLEEFWEEYVEDVSID